MLVRLSVAAAMLVSATQAQAAAGKGTVTFSLPALSYTSTDSTVKPDTGEEAKETTTELETADLEAAYLQATLGSINFYFYPFTDAKVVSGSYLIKDKFEIGLNLGLHSVKAKEADTASDDSLIGAFFYFYPQLGPTTGEFAINIDSVSSKSESVDTSGATPTTVKTDESGLNIKLIANVLVPMGKNFYYVGGLWYGINSSEDKESKAKTTDNQLGLNLATLRFMLD